MLQHGFETQQQLAALWYEFVLKMKTAACKEFMKNTNGLPIVDLTTLDLDRCKPYEECPQAKKCHAVSCGACDRSPVQYPAIPIPHNFECPLLEKERRALLAM